PSSGEIACGDSSQPKSIAQGEPKKQEVNVKPTASSAKVCSTRQVCVSFSERKLYLEHHPYPEDIFLVIEFSQATLAKDLGNKKLIYAKAGIKEYWVVNLKDACVHIFRDLVQKVYTTEFTLTTGTIAPLAFPNIQLQVQRLMNP
ncbi:MAG: Uma2 family endonuclease, partial [Symploca sp. SIO2G7]|nr:Uma2 family endonuclease [Symploca sp. SIO2G7]